MQAQGYNFGGQSSSLLHITDNYDDPIILFEKWLAEAEANDNLDWVKVMNISTVNEKLGVLSRNVILRKFDQSGFVFVTERNTRKYKDLKENPAVAATFFWKYQLNGNVVLKQVRINGKVSELSPEEISKFYVEEGPCSKIRSKICVCGEPCNWNDLKKKHDEVLENFQNGTDKLEQMENYTAMIIEPEIMDFYYSLPTCVADRILYTKNQMGKWSNQHVCA